MFSKTKMNKSIDGCSDKLAVVIEKIKDADAIVLGAGAGLSTAAGFTYSGERFEQYFSDFAEKYGFEDMYSGGFYTQGDYGLFQCSKPCHAMTYDNEEVVRKMVQSQGFQIENGKLIKPKNTEILMSVPTELVPKCPKCGRPMSMNLRADNTFVEDAGWHSAANRYERFMEQHMRKKIVFLELGVGYNTPGIIKYNFWQYANNWQHAFYVCINKGQAYVPDDIADKSIGIDADIAEVISDIQSRI